MRRASDALRLAWQARGRVLVSLDPDSALGCAIRRAVLGPKRLKWVAEIHEDYEALLEDRAWATGLAGAVGRAVARAGEKVAARADLTVVADEALALQAPRRLVVRNLPDLTMLPQPVAREAKPRALYVGDLTASRGLFTMLQATQAAPNWRLDLVGRLNPDDQPAVEALLASAPDLASRVTLHGMMPPRQAWKLAAGAWVGLSLLEITRASRQAMPSKIFEYLVCGLPVLTSPLPRPARLIETSGAGAVVDQAAEAAQVLERWSSQPRALAEAAAAAERVGHEIVKQCGEMEQEASQIKSLIP